MQLTARQRDVQQLARQIASEAIAPSVTDNDRSARFPVDALGTLASAGLMGVNIEEQFGGLGAGVIAYSLAVTEVAAVDPAVAVTMCVNNMVAEVVHMFGQSEHHAAYLPAMMSGAINSGSFCLSEAGAGSDPQGMKTRAERTEDGWLLNGTKAWITSGAHAGVFVVWAKTDDRITAFLVDPATDGISAGKAEEKMGQHASNTVTLAFDDVLIPADSVLGELGGGFPIAMMALDGGRIGIASQALGIARTALELTDDPLLRAQYEAAQRLVLRAAWLKESKAERFSREASMAKLYCSELASRACDAAMQAVGVSSFTQDHVLAKMLRDARVTRIYEGTNEIQRIVIAREVLRHGVFGTAI